MTRDVDHVLCEALEHASDNERAAYLDRACGEDQELRRQVETLLSAHFRAGDFLESPAVPPTVCLETLPVLEAPGMVIGPYRVLEPIGEGGMGIVFMAEQIHPVRRKVALKIIKPGMDTRQVIARFEAERQALALMDHPNIARVLDAGTTDSGRPYFVMELVRGIPITDYCDREKLSIADRLELFVLVCRAVQHAHQKAVIHRDLKPTNVLITVIDGVPVPKVIDFGVAKATTGSLTDQTLFTGFAQMVGTPLYMSPEQAELSGIDVDTRSDVYSLGVLLYELLTGTTPFDRDALRKAAFDEMRRIIREEEPPKPSTRLSSLGVSLSTVSSNRAADPRRMCRSVRGDLDWIVMKALEKDRQRRYETANDFSADVMRYLTNRPVEASSPNAWYRFGKLARRNRGALMTGVLVSVALVVGVTASVWQAVRATRAEREAHARRQQVATNLRLALRTLDSIYLKVAETRLPRKATLAADDRALIEQTLAFYDEFARANNQSQGVRYEVARAHQRAGKLHYRLRESKKAELAMRRAAALAGELAAEQPNVPDGRVLLADSLDDMSRLLDETGRTQEGGQAIEESLKLRKALALEYPRVARYREDLARCLGHVYTHRSLAGQAGEAVEAESQALPIWEALVRDDPESLVYMSGMAACVHNRGVALWATGHNQDAAEQYRKARDILRRLLAKHPEDVECRGELVNCCYNLGIVLGKEHPQDAERFMQESLDIGRRLVADYPSVPDYRNHLAMSLDHSAVLLQISGRLDQAEKRYRDSLSLQEVLLSQAPEVSDYQSRYGGTLNNLAILVRDRGDLDEARQLLEKAISHQRAALKANPSNPDYRQFLYNHYKVLAPTLLSCGDFAEAATVLERFAEVYPDRMRDALLAANTLCDIVRRVEADQGLEKPDRASLVEEYSARSWTLFGEAIRRAAGDPEQLNDLAWRLAVYPDTRFRDPRRAVELARKTLERAPEKGEFWNTLGVALYRAGEWSASIDALQNSMKRNSGGDASDWFFLAMDQKKLGNLDEARSWFDKAVRSVESYRTQNEELFRFRAEAAALLGVSDSPSSEHGERQEPQGPPG